ncbi:MAG: SDR family oxidoreductase [Miltoncostaeaceae bacterium]
METSIGASRVLLTGATGYVGGHLLSSLEDDGRKVRCLTRRPAALRERVAPTTDVVEGDVLDEASLADALRGIDVAVYLVHSMARLAGYRATDRDAARAFGRAARSAGVRRIVYLGGLGEGPDLSEHLESRHEVGDLLRSSGVDVIELRASVVLGAGSVAWEVVRALVDRLPVMVTPRWVDTPTQPIALSDVIAYLREAVDAPPGRAGVYEIGGDEVVSYGGIMSEYARQRGLRRMLLRVPVLTPYLSSLWLGLVTPAHARVGRELVAGLRTSTVVNDRRALRDFDVRPLGLRSSVEQALRREDHEFARTRWAEALRSARRQSGYGGVRYGMRLVDSRSVTVPVPPHHAFAPIRRIGGDRGWYYADSLWKLRGAMDAALGGVGMRRGRRDGQLLAPGDVLDWWRVESYEPDRLLRLRAEMKLPGRAWLQFEIAGGGERSRITQTALFDPVGLVGHAYWYALWPAHQVIFGGLIRRLGDLAVAEGADAPGGGG